MFSFLHQPTLAFCLSAADTHVLDPDNHVLEVVDGDGVIDNADRDPTHLSQHLECVPSAHRL